MVVAGSNKSVPRHVAIIMDGNGRWAKKRQMPRVFGHQKGADRVREIVESAGEAGVQYLTLYAFSEENWARPADEVNALFKLLVKYLHRETEALHKKNVRLRTIGDVTKLPAVCQTALLEAMEKTRDNTGLQLTLALNYSGRSELVHAFREIAAQVAKGALKAEDINHQLVAAHLDTAGIPDPDLLIRTSGEQRVSNFLLWQLAYSEFYFTDVNWPAFSKKHFLEAIHNYMDRDRRYGCVKSEENVINHPLASSENFSGATC